MGNRHFMVQDIKYQYQLRAEEIAQEEYNLEWEDLSEEEQLKVYDKAIEDVHERLIAQAESIADALKENPERGLKV